MSLINYCLNKKEKEENGLATTPFIWIHLIVFINESNSN